MSEPSAQLARASTLIAAPRAQVWAALLRPDTLTRIMPVTEVVAGWRLGEPFHWRVEMLGKPYDVTGKVLRVEPEQLLEYDFLDPHSAKVLRVENWHRVRITLSDEGGRTRVSIEQDNNLSPAALAHAEGGWRLALNNLKGVAEAH